MVHNIIKLVVGVSLSLSFSAHGSIIAFWDFNDIVTDGPDEIPDETVEIVHNASQGSGTLYQQRAETDGNGKGGVAYTNSIEGINAVEGRAFAWDDVARSGNNDAQFFITIDTTGFQDIMIRFDVRGNLDLGIESFDLEYATNGIETVTQTQDQVDLGEEDFVGTFVDFLNGESERILNNAPVPVGNIIGPVDDQELTFEEITLDLSSTTGLNNQSSVVLRFDDWRDNDELTIDNFLITGTAIPEPSSTALLGLGGIALITRRRRSA